MDDERKVFLTMTGAGTACGFMMWLAFGHEPLYLMGALLGGFISGFIMHMLG